MALSPELREHLHDLFGGLGPIQVRRMFGGAGIYLDDACFALVIQDEIFLRGDDSIGPEIEAAGGARWIYDSGRRGPVVMPYWRLPDQAMDDPDEAAAWARKALGPAEAAAAKKRAAKARKAARNNNAGKAQRS